MYGIINKAAETFVRSRYGDAVWDRVRLKAGLPDEPFISMNRYDDSATYGILGAASEVTGTHAEQVIEAFGVYWIEYVFDAGYGRMVLTTGDTLATAFRRLDEMHDRIRLAFPDSQAPRFSVVGETTEGLTVDYRSERPGLAPFVIGLIRGIGRRLGSEVSAVHERVQPHDGPAHDRFHVSWGAGSPSPS
jgi:hypothetical protein